MTTKKTNQAEPIEKKEEAAPAETPTPTEEAAPVETTEEVQTDQPNPELDKEIKLEIAKCETVEALQEFNYENYKDEIDFRKAELEEATAKPDEEADSATPAEEAAPDEEPAPAEEAAPDEDKAEALAKDMEDAQDADEGKAEGVAEATAEVKVESAERKQERIDNKEKAKKKAKKDAKAKAKKAAKDAEEKANKERADAMCEHYKDEIERFELCLEVVEVCEQKNVPLPDYDNRKAVTTNFLKAFLKKHN